MLKQKFLDKFIGDKANPLVPGHFEGTAGMHFGLYFAKDRLYQHPSVIRKIAEYMAGYFYHQRPEVVAVPAIGGCILGNRVAESLSSIGRESPEVLSVYAEKDPKGGLVFKRGYGELLYRRRVLVVDDVINTGHSVTSLLHAVKGTRGMVVGVGAICIHNTDVLSKVSLQNWLVCLDEPNYNPSECPLCHLGIPLSKELGHG